MDPGYGPGDWTRTPLAEDIICAFVFKVSHYMPPSIAIQRFHRLLPGCCLLALLVPWLSAPVAADPVFREVTEETGLDFWHFNGMSGDLHMVEMVGAGAGLFDFDNDGDLDIYLGQGHMLDPALEPEQSTTPPKDPHRPLVDRLYRNDLEIVDGKAVLRFTDVTQASGLDARGYAMGVAAADFNNDGWIDLLITNWGSNQLWVNNGDGTFSDISAKAGIDDPRWAVPASFVDYDRDGWLDLYIGNYIKYKLDRKKLCYTVSKREEYCGPLSYESHTDLLFHNKHDDTFENVSETAGITQAKGGALGVVTADFNNDQWPDIYVANDGVPNQLWINQKDGTFSEEALLAGVAVNMAGSAEASMGVDAADFDGDGDQDLFMTHVIRETNTLYVNDGNGWFEDQTVIMGLANPSFSYTGFGTAWFDYDNDGWLDLFIANGSVSILEDLVKAGDPFPLRQPNQLFRNVGKGHYAEVSNEAGPAFELVEVSRAAAFGDIDNDGDTDLLVTNNNGPARLLLNETGNRNAWLGLRLMESTGTRDALGAEAAIILDGQPTLWRRVYTDGSYAAVNDARILFGLGKDASPRDVLVIWPNGHRETWTSLEPGRYHTLQQGAAAD